MTVTAWVNYVRLLEADGTPTGYDFQDYFVGEVKAYSAVDYAFAPFELSVGGGVSGGDRSSADFVTPVNAISTAIATEAVDNAWLLLVDQVKIDRATGDNLVLFTQERWLCNSYSYVESAPVITLSLGSPLNAVDGLVGRTLTTKLVGRLPATGGIRLG